MNTHTVKLVLALGLALGATGGQAASYSGEIDIDPALYSGSLNTPFLLDFQLNSGGGATPVSNSVTISNISFSGSGTPGPTGSATVSGSVVGDLSSSVSLFDSAANPYSELFQSFSIGTTKISFNIDTTDNVNASAPDLFAVALLDSSAGNPQLLTTAPDTVSFITLSFSNPAQIAAYSGADTASGVTSSVSAVPVPAAVWLFGSALAGMGLFGRRKPV